ncbi:conserved hypothetical protein [gamma proteobacterium HTCC5015]|nr:conserved hypothetical protein [gamma proteobacterium HTCC5015]
MFIAALAVAAGVMLASANSHFVDFNYMAGDIRLPFVVWLFFSLLIGVCLGLCVAMVWAARLHRQVRRSERNREMLQKELDNLRRLRSGVAQ